MKNNAKGFTLIEVLIALVIISVALTAVIKTTTQNIRDTQYLQNKMVAHWVGLYVLNEIRAGVIKLTVQSDNMSQSIQMLGEKWSWQASLHGTRTATIKEIHVSVAHEPDEKVFANMTGYLYVTA
jgi:general secretion pathway protein I